MIKFILEQFNLEGDAARPWTTDNPLLKSAVATLVEGTLGGDETSYSDFHHLLATLNQSRLGLCPGQSLLHEQQIRSLCVYLENQWLKHEGMLLGDYLKDVPKDPREFVLWFETLRENGPGQNHPLFLYLSERATWDEFRYFLKQELATEAGFDDLLAMTQVQTPLTVKMELARNFWDEMGDGKADEVHSRQLGIITDAFKLDWQERFEDVHWAPLALSNVMIALASNRSCFAQSVGALGVIELTSPGRCAKVVEGLRRIGLSSKDYHYYALHSVLDVEHWEGWKSQVVYPLIEEQPARMSKIAEGALLRLFAGKRCFEAYSKHLSLFFEQETVLPDQDIQSDYAASVSVGHGIE